MRATLAFAFAILTLPIPGYADSAICTVEGVEHPDINAIALDSIKKTARVEHGTGASLEGVVTSIRPHGESGIKVNILIRHDEPFYGVDETEYAVFNLFVGGWRIIGAAYVIKDGRRHLDQIKSSLPAKCIVL